MRKIALVLTALLYVGRVHAQPTQQSLDAEINQLLPSNNRNEISAMDLRQVLTDMTTAIFTAQSSWSVGGAAPLSVPTQTAPISATLAVGGAYNDSSSGNIFQISSWLTNAGSRPAVAVFGQGQATGNGSKVWGANFVAYANVNGSFAQGVEIDCGSAGGTSSALAYCISVNAGGTTGSNGNLGLQFSSLGAGATFVDAIAFLINGSVQPFTNALLATGGALNPNYGINFSSAAFQIAAIATPGFTVDPSGDVLVLRAGSAGYATIGRADNPGAGNQLSAVNFQANNASGAAKLYGQVSAWADTVTAGSEAGHVCLATEVAGSLGNMLCAGGGVAIGSYAGNNTPPANGVIVSGHVAIATATSLNTLDVAGGVAIGSFAGSSSPPTNGLIVSAGVGIGTNLPKSELDVAGGISVGAYGGVNAAPSNGLIVSGQVGVGTAGTSHSLDVTGSASSTYIEYITNSYSSAGGGGLGIQAGVNGSDSSTIMIGFYNGGGSALGNITRNGTGIAYNTTSDRRLKQNIRPTEWGLWTLMRIPVVDFDFIEDRDHMRVPGFVAQDLAPLYPFAVATHGDDGVSPLSSDTRTWSIDYSRPTPLIMRSVQELTLIVGALFIMVLILGFYLVIGRQRLSQ